MEPPVQSIRIDKWLWSVRLYKSRSIATEACTNGKVQVNGQPAKPSRTVRTGDIIMAVAGEILRTVKVVSPLEKRVGAKLVSHFLEDLTPATEFAKRKEKNLQPFVFRAKGKGRPTKKERRSIEDFMQ